VFVLTTHLTSAVMTMETPP